MTSTREETINAYVQLDLTAHIVKRMFVPNVMYMPIVSMGNAIVVLVSKVTVTSV